MNPNLSLSICSPLASCEYLDTKSVAAPTAAALTHVVPSAVAAQAGTVTGAGTAVATNAVLSGGRKKKEAEEARSKVKEFERKLKDETNARAKAEADTIRSEKLVDTSLVGERERRKVQSQEQRGKKKEGDQGVEIKKEENLVREEEKEGEDEEEEEEEEEGEEEKEDEE